MRKLFFGILILLVFASASLAIESSVSKGALNIFAESEDVEIYVDLDYIGKGLVSLIDPVPGKHYVKATQNGQIIFSEIVDVDPEKVNSVLIKTSPRILTPPPETEYSKLKALEKPAEPGPGFKPFGIGFEMGWPFYGLNFDFWLSREHGLSMNYYSSSSSSSYTTQHYSARYKYKFSDNGYVSLGAGKYTDRRYNYSYLPSSMIDYAETVAAILFGIMPNEFTTFEFGYGQKFPDSGASMGMITLSGGVHYYF